MKKKYIVRVTVTAGGKLSKKLVRDMVQEALDGFFPRTKTNTDVNIVARASTVDEQ